MSGSRPLSVLIVEDVPTDAELMTHALRRHGFAPEWTRVDTEAAYVEALERPPDVVLCDYTLPGFDALQALAHLRRQGLGVPFLVVTGNVSEEVAVACMKAGASDFLNKDRLARLGPAVEQALDASRTRAEKDRAEAAEKRMLTALLEAERRFRGIFDAASAFMGLLDPSGTVLEANRSALAGVGRDAVVGRPFHETPWWARPAGARESVRSAVERAAAGETVRLEVEIAGEGGRSTLSELSITPVRDETGRVALLVPEGFDVTARKAAEESLRRHREQLEALVSTRTAELHASERRASFLRDVASAANESGTAAEVLFSVLRLAAAHFGFSGGRAFLVDRVSGRLTELGAWQPPEDDGAPEGSVAVPRDDLAHDVAARGLPGLRTLDASSTPRRRDELGRTHAHAFPVLSGGRAAAVLELFGGASPDPARETPDLVEQVTRQVAVALERLQAEATLQKLTLAVRHSPAAVVVTDREGRIEYVNPAFEAATGYSEAEALGQTPRILKSGVHPASFYERLWETILGGETWRGELCNRRKDGTLFWESAVVSPIRNALGEVTNFVAVKLDISELREASARLEQARDAAERANRTKSIFLASMSHEIRTPLNAILGFSQLLLHDRSLSDLQQGQIASIRSSGEHLLDLIDDVLEMSRIEAGRASAIPVATDLGETLSGLERVFRRRADEKRLSFEVQRAPDLPPHVLVDEGKLRQIVSNLVGNAVKFTRTGGVVVRVRADAAEDGRAWLAVDVEDTGAGIAAPDLPRLFRPFETARGGTGGGTGLGLALSRAFARLMGGDVSVTSRPGVGSVFSLAVPVEVAPGPPARPAFPARAVVGLAGGERPRRVLVVDDVEENRVIVTSMLTRVGFEARSEPDGPSGISAFAAWQPDLVLMDLRMPGLDGIDAIRALRRDFPSRRVPIVALTASANEEDRRLVAEAGGDAFVGKPFREDELYGTIGALLGVRYAFESDPASPPAAPAHASVSPAAVPEPFRAMLRDAVIRADLDAILTAAAELAATDAGSADAIRALAEGFDYEGLLALVGGAPPPE